MESGRVLIRRGVKQQMAAEDIAGTLSHSQPLVKHCSSNALSCKLTAELNNTELQKIKTNFKAAHVTGSINQQCLHLVPFMRQKAA